MHLAPQLASKVLNSAPVQGAKQTFGDFINRLPDLLSDESPSNGLATASNVAPLDEAQWRSERPDSPALHTDDGVKTPKQVFDHYQAWAQHATPEQLQDADTWLKDGPVTLQQKIARQLVSDEISR